MKLRTLFSACCLLMAGISFVACEDNDVKKVTTSVTLKAPDYLTDKNPDVALNEVIVKNVNTGVESVAYSAKDTKADETAYTESVTVEITVPEGFYNITMNGTISYDNNGERTSTGLRSYQEAVTLTEETASVPVQADNSFVYSPEAESEDASGDFVIAEIFFAGTLTPERKQYHNDTYIRIYNNSNDTLLADGLAVAESSLLTNYKLEEMTPNFINERFSFTSLFRIPKGTNLYVNPGESILLADCARDHRVDGNVNSFDLSKADLEWYDVSSNPNFLDSDNPDVPNMEKIYSNSKTISQFTTQGNRSYAILRIDESQYPTGEAFMADSTNYCTYTRTFTNSSTGVTYKFNGNAWTVPNEWIIDAVNCCPSSDFQWLVTSPALDKGYTSVAETGNNESRYGKSVRRRVAAGKKLQDSNDSSLDFEAVSADPYYKFHD